MRTSGHRLGAARPNLVWRTGYLGSRVLAPPAVAEPEREAFPWLRDGSGVPVPSRRWCAPILRARSLVGGFR
jgi:hypothetical protein